MKVCPFCAEQILAGAKKCRHCGETVDVSLRVAEEALRASNRQTAVYMNAGGGAAAVSDDGNWVEARSFPHTFHLFMSFATLGIWIPVYLIHYAIWRR